MTYYLAQGPSGSANPGANDGVLSPIAPRSPSAKDSYSANYTITAATRDTQGITYTTAALPSDMVACRLCEGGHLGVLFGNGPGFLRLS